MTTKDEGDFLHAAVYHEHDLAHDPDPSGDGIDSKEILGFIVPLSPQLLAKRKATHHES